MSQTIELVIGKYSETFEHLACNICDNCIAQTDDCECFNNRECPYHDNMEELHRLCFEADQIAGRLRLEVEFGSRYDIAYDYRLDNY